MIKSIKNSDKMMGIKFMKVENENGEFTSKKISKKRILDILWMGLNKKLQRSPKINILSTEERNLVNKNSFFVFSTTFSRAFSVFTVFIFKFLGKKSNLTFFIFCVFYSL